MTDAMSSNALPRWLMIISVIPPVALIVAALAKAMVDLQADAPESFARGFLAGCGEPCMIRYNPGGYRLDYLALAAAVETERRTIVIAGDCISGCATMADQARGHVCLMPSARFYFHQGSNGVPQDLSPDLTAWVDAHGGFPSFRSQQFTAMPFEDARAFWQLCPGMPGLPLPSLTGTLP